MSCVDVFISHQQLDTAKAVALKDKIEDLKFSCYISAEDVELSDKWPGALPRSTHSPSESAASCATTAAPSSPTVRGRSNFRAGCPGTWIFRRRVLAAILCSFSRLQAPPFDRTRTFLVMWIRYVGDWAFRASPASLARTKRHPLLVFGPMPSSVPCLSQLSEVMRPT
jgi:hypothetical protein